MFYRLFTTTEEKFFNDFMALLDHLESNYPALRFEFKHGAYQLYDISGEQDVRIGYYEII
jgi:hypothetical protein